MQINFNYKTELPLEKLGLANPMAMKPFMKYRPALLLDCTCLAITISILINHNVHLLASAISIKPADFDRLIMPCYLGGGSSSSAYAGSSMQSLAQSPNLPPNQNFGSGNYPGQIGRTNANWQNIPSSASGNGPIQPTYYAADVGRSGGQTGFTSLGQQVPRANTMDNFIALVSKIETSNPRLATNPDQLIRVLLSRFRMDNYYYDVNTRTPIIDQDHRTLNMIPAILNSIGQAQQTQYMLASDTFPEHILDHDEKCSMYFMLSHFIDKSASVGSAPSVGAPVSQISASHRPPPNLQASGSGYPAVSANSALNGGPRYPGPSPSFGSPATKNMNSFGVGINNNPEYTGNNPYGMNVPQPNPQFNQNYNNVRNSGQYSGTLSSNTKYFAPIIEGNARYRDERLAIEYGVVTVANQENAAIVLNRVLMGILSATTSPQTIRQLASVIYPTQAITNTPKMDEEIDPLFGVTLADLWAISSIAKAGKSFDFRMLGDNGRWNDTMCPIAFHLDRPNSIRFTTAELIGGLDGFSLGMFRRRLLSMRKNIRLSEMLRMYYSKTGFRPQFAEIGVCNRGTVINTQLDDLHRQAENYLRLYQLNLPISDNEIALSINRLESFKEISRQVANQYAPPEICQETSYNDPYPQNQQDQCEIAKADVVTVLDSSPQANDAFMHLVVTKLAQRLGLSRQSNSFTILTNQQDTSGYAGAYSFNAIVRNSTNTAEIGCSLVYDASKTYQGGQITDPTRIVEMFERALINLDSEYLFRQMAGSPTSSTRQATYVSSLFEQSDNLYSNNGAGPKNTGGAKVIVWFNHGSQMKPAPIGSYPTNWNGPSYPEQNQYKFYEAKKYLRENFRGAAILAIASNRDNVKNFVYDEDRDLLIDEHLSDSASPPSDYTNPSALDPTTIATLTGPADQLVTKLVQRMCDVPAVFQYPMCFRAPSDNVISVGYISPGRKQYWMMSPKTFFASRSVRMAFKVEGGRLKVCFGRMVKPDESAQRSGQNYQSGSISFSIGTQSGSPGSNVPVTSTSSSSNNYYTGLENGICKDISPGQEIDFVVDDPCYKKSIAECEPFYYVIKEISNPGESDPSYMCKDEGCKRFDQAKFIMTHTGVICSSAFKSLKANWILILISIIASLAINNEIKFQHSNLLANKGLLTTVAFVFGTICLITQQVQAQQAVNDYGAGRSGEKRGNFTPSEMLAVTLLVMTVLAGLALTIGLCYYVSKRNSNGMTKVEQDDY